MVRRRVYRLIFGALVLASALVLVTGHLQAAAERPGEPGQAAPDFEAPPADGVTVITTDSNVWLTEQEDGPRQEAEIVAFDRDGDVLYHDDSRDRYWDVDPVSNGSTTVLYAASDHLYRSECPASTACTRNVVETVNLSTGEVTVLYSKVTPHKHSTRWHDVDRLDDGRLVVADIARDRVYVVDPETELVEWSWDARTDYPLDGGGPYPRDWTHLNDVDVLEDGRIVASLRNQDQVVFLDPETGLREAWTLGADDDHDVLYEQHNPDYVPGSRGGPAVVVADSENNRVVEYQRVDGEWERSWTWADAGLQWPRDADRLPDGNTLVTDSNGDRVLEVNREGEVVWEVDVPFPYEAERLGTGPGSSGGQSAASLGLESREPGDTGSGDSASGGILTTVWLAIRGAVPGPVLNSIAYAIPQWATARELAALVVLASSLTAWAAIEVSRSPYDVGLRNPITVERE